MNRPHNLATTLSRRAESLPRAFWAKTQGDRRRPRRLALEGLERRETMAASVTFSGTELRIAADSRGTTALVQDLDPTNSASAPDLYLVVAQWADGAISFTVPKSAVGRIHFRGSDQSDTFRNMTGLPSVQLGLGGSDQLTGGWGRDELYGGSLNDFLYGGLGQDLLDGEAGVDWLYGDMLNDSVQGHDDVLIGGRDVDTLYGGGGKDTIRGGDDDSAVDYLYGEAGHDILRGGAGNDWLWGGDGNDDLIGETGNDYLSGGIGNDGLFGGMGINELWSGEGRDRILVRHGLANEVRHSTATYDVVYDKTNDDALVVFRDWNLPASFEQYTYAPAMWTDADIEKVDAALKILHQETGNTFFLKRNGGGEIHFYRLGIGTGGPDPYDGWNNGVSIVLNDHAFERGKDFLIQSVLHEIGHFWDSTGDLLETDFRAVSGWRQVFQFDADGTGRPSFRWVYDSATNHKFVEDYGKRNPREDFATIFAKYFLHWSAIDYQINTGGISEGPLHNTYEKERVLNRFVNEVSDRYSREGERDAWYRAQIYAR